MGDTLIIPAPKRLTRGDKKLTFQWSGDNSVGASREIPEFDIKGGEKGLGIKLRRGEGVRPSRHLPVAHLRAPRSGDTVDTLTNVTCAPAGAHRISVNSLLVFLCFTLILKSSFLFLNDLFLRKRSSLAAFPREQFPGCKGCRS